MDGCRQFLYRTCLLSGPLRQSLSAVRYLGSAGSNLVSAYINLQQDITESVFNLPNGGKQRSKASNIQIRDLRIYNKVSAAHFFQQIVDIF